LGCGLVSVRREAKNREPFTVGSCSEGWGSTVARSCMELLLHGRDCEVTYRGRRRRRRRRRRSSRRRDHRLRRRLRHAQLRRQRREVQVGRDVLKTSIRAGALLLSPAGDPLEFRRSAGSAGALVDWMRPRQQKRRARLRKGPTREGGGTGLNSLRCGSRAGSSCPFALKHSR
jgi:hypothetical protein